jgi:hypothetical protein
MSYYAVIREAGPGWIDGGIAAQPDVADHAAFMNNLADEGLVLFAGPLAGTETARLRALLIMEANTEGEIRERLADDRGRTRTDSRSHASSPGTSSSGRSGCPRRRAEPRHAGSGLPRRWRCGRGSTGSLGVLRRPATVLAAPLD